MHSLHSLLGNAWSVVLIVLFFGGSIFIHELGHFLAARRRGVKVDRFSIGFGPKIFGWRGRDGVEYRVSWLPLGGYVALPQLADMRMIEGESEEGLAQLAPVSYTSKILVFVMGAVFNVLFAFGLATVLWIVGQPTSEELSTTRIGYVARTVVLPDRTEVASPAMQAGLQVGDTIRAIDGVPVHDWSELLQTLITSSNVTRDGRREAVFTIDRGGRSIDLTIYPRLSGEDKVRRVGILAAYTPIVAAVEEGSIAQRIGLRAGDRLIEMDGKPLLNLVTLGERLQQEPHAPIAIRVDRGGQPLDLTIPAERSKDAPELLGASFRTAVGLIHQNPFEQILSQLRGIVRVISSLLHPTSDINVSKLSGPVGIGKIFWDAAEAGFRYVLWIAIVVNVNLAVFNLLPIPVLDGGHMLFATIAKLRGRALPANFIAATQSVFIVLIFSMILYVSFYDVKRIVRDSRSEPPPQESRESPPDATQPKEPAPAKP